MILVTNFINFKQFYNTSGIIIKNIKKMIFFI
jgi:hypothetical protein